MTLEPSGLGFSATAAAANACDNECRVDQPNHRENSNPAASGDDPGDEQEEADQEGSRVTHK
jgi:hypothetical protein